MPVIINELVLRGSIQQPSTNGRSPVKPPRDAQADRDAIVETSVERVMEILEREKER